jgi:hypothetical protein
VNTIEQVLAKNLAALGLSYTTNKNIIRYLVRHSPSEIILDETRGNDETYRQVKLLARQITVGRIVEIYADDCPQHTSFDVLARVLVEEGLTHLHWHCIPALPAIPEKLEGVSKEQLLMLSPEMLKTLSLKAFLALTKASGKTYQRQKITIADLLKVDPSVVSELATCKSALSKTRTLLSVLGFTYEDGVLMQWGTRRASIEHIQKECALRPEEAARVVEYMRSKKMIPEFLFPSRHS